MMIAVCCLVFQLVAFIPLCQSGDNVPIPTHFPAKILMIPLYIPGSSQDQMLMTIGEGLTEREHVLHLLINTLPRDEKLLSNFKASDVVSYVSAYTEEDVATFYTKVMSELEEYGGGPGGFDLISKVMNFASEDCKALFTDSNTLARLKNEAYDMLITEVFFPCNVLLAKYLNVPFIALTSSRELPLMRKSMYGFPAELSYSPEIFFGATDKMTFLQRVSNVFQHLFFSYVAPQAYLADYYQIQKEFDIEPDTYLSSMIGQAALWLSYSDISLDFPGPVMPNFVHIGGMAVKDAKGLDKVRQSLLI